MARHRHQEFIRFLNALERETRPARTVHAILDNHAAHKTPEVRRWLARHPHWTFPFTPTSSSWLDAVEGFFAKLSRRRLKRGVFPSVVDLQAAINRFVTEHYENPRPSSGAPIPTRSSPPAPEGSKRWSHSTRTRSICHRWCHPENMGFDIESNTGLLKAIIRVYDES